jgi:tetratricopeptide (TPR) repeat protein
MFRVLAVVIAVLPFLIAEAICRFNGFGGYPAVLQRLRTVEGRTYVLSFQPAVDSFFRRNSEVTGGMHEQVFTIPRDPDSVRIFCLGGSAMQGYPQPRMLAAPSFLQAMLSDLWPDRRVEVINLGATAIASFPVASILEEALEFEPDLVIIYTGNNEFYGAYGVASLHAFGRSTTAMRILRTARRSALIQWIEHLDPGSVGAGAGAHEERRTLMEQVIKYDQIGPEDRLRRAAGDNLGRHLRQMVRRCREREVPVMVCTLPANEQDLWPLGIDPEPALSQADRTAFAQHLREAEEELLSDPDAAAGRLRLAIQLYDGHARSHFLLGRALAMAGRPQEARVHFQRARELDPMPWRAPGSLNERVREAAREGAVLCDLQREFESASSGGAIGWELMDDHVHPSLRGQALVATAWVRSMAGLPEPLRVGPDAAANLPDWQEYATQLGANRFDAYAVAQKLSQLFRAPFYARSNPEGLGRQGARIREIKDSLTATEQTAVGLWQDPETHKRSLRPITGIVGAGLMTEGRFAEADRLLCIARRNVAKYSVWNLELTWMALQCRQNLRPQLLPEDLALAEEMIRDGNNIYLATGVSSPKLQRLMQEAADLILRHEGGAEAADQEKDARSAELAP